MEPENTPLEEEIIFQTIVFRFQPLILGGVVLVGTQKKHPFLLYLNSTALVPSQHKHPILLSRKHHLCQPAAWKSKQIAHKFYTYIYMHT